MGHWPTLQGLYVQSSPPQDGRPSDLKGPGSGSRGPSQCAAPGTQGPKGERGDQAETWHGSDWGWRRVGESRGEDTESKIVESERGSSALFTDGPPSQKRDAKLSSGGRQGPGRRQVSRLR
ncbi:unnamed protein product [Pipistrellus nathusii]|uniref:Uncharacterized protein n=1 Tax=Pipistrellus nathusii TaxID=59473 RepID=A0ABN9ZS57_PIPNA